MLYASSNSAKSSTEIHPCAIKCSYRSLNYSRKRMTNALDILSKPSFAFFFCLYKSRTQFNTRPNIPVTMKLNAGDIIQLSNLSIVVVLPDMALRGVKCPSHKRLDCYLADVSAVSTFTFFVRATMVSIRFPSASLSIS